MGYGHTFPRMRKITNEEWTAITQDVRALINALPPHSSSAGAFYVERPLALTFDDEDGVIHSGAFIDHDHIVFNGDPSMDLDYEEFFVDRNSVDPYGRNNPEIPFGLDYCKTERKPYDLVVCAVLAVMEDRAPGGWNIDSDGGIDDWQPALAWASEVLGRDLVSPVPKHANASAPTQPTMSP